MFVRATVYLAVILGLVAAPAAAFEGRGTPSPGVATPAFFTEGTTLDGAGGFAKWTSMLQRHVRQGGNTRGCDGEGADCAYEAWLVRLLRLAEAPVRERIATVNRWVNQNRYVSDKEAFGLRDYWATPREFLAGAGDCEDFAILKYLSLRALGIAADDMRIVVLEDTRDGLPHAVLVVRIDGAAVVLDNRTSIIAAPMEVPHYRAYYAVNEYGWWRA